MALASAPSTPEKAGLSPSIRRSFTAPIGTTKSAARITRGPGDDAETLYTHSAGKIISFTHSSNAARRHSSVSNGRAEFQEEPSGTLPWASTTERTIAAGPLQIYRVLGSVAFLNSGATLHPILAKSQCWCVDGESKFVLRIRPNSYYRIELPFRTSAEKMKVEEFKDVLGKVLCYEVTPCPFKRGFTVDLPEPPTTPVQKRPWKPKSKLATTPENVTGELGTLNFRPTRRAVRSPAVEQNDEEESGDAIEPVELVGKKEIHDLIAYTDSSSAGSDNEHGRQDTGDIETSPQQLSNEMSEGPLDFKTPTRPKAWKAGRADTAPPQLSLTIIPSSTYASDEPSFLKADQDSLSLSSSLDSFHSFHSPISPLAPSPAFPDLDSLPQDYINGASLPRAHNHKRDVSEITVTDQCPELWDMTDRRSSIGTAFQPTPTSSGTPPLVDDAASEEDENWSEAVTPSPTKELRRRRLSPRLRTESPLPPPANLYSPYSPRSSMSGHHLTTAILQRTCSLLLGPPAQLVALMLRIAAKIAKGTFRGSSFGFGEGGQKIPCSWDFSDGSDDNDDEDDYGVPLSRPTSRSMRAKEAAGSWEID
ncbi:hypothetical protein ACLMJK_000401 [Lecanora helva]